jgi:hypothetical protein
MDKQEIYKLSLSERGSDGKIPFHPYKKWYGAHWVLALLADLDYPKGDQTLIPLREQVYDWLLSEEHTKKHLRVINGLTRRCASQEGYAIYYLTNLGLDDERTKILAGKLLTWQWPDGGWNCDKDPSAHNSSFMESLIPMWSLWLYAQKTGDKKYLDAAHKTSEIFLKRHLYRSQSTGRIIRHEFVELHYPLYWHYDILFGLRVLADMELINDPRCKEALDLLESKRLPDGGFPAEAKYYHPYTHEHRLGVSLVNWGGIGKKKANEFITRDALYVLKAAGRTL